MNPHKSNDEKNGRGMGRGAPTSRCDQVAHEFSAKNVSILTASLVAGENGSPPEDSGWKNTKKYIANRCVCIHVYVAISRKNGELPRVSVGDKITHCFPSFHLSTLPPTRRSLHDLFPQAIVHSLRRVMNDTKKINSLYTNSSVFHCTGAPHRR